MRESVREKVGERERFSVGQFSGEEWTVFVDNLSKRVTRKTLKEIFHQQGSVVRVYIPNYSNKPNYRNYTFAFVQLANEDGLLKAIANINGIWIDGKKISVGVAKYQKKRLKQAGRSNDSKEVDKWKKDTHRSRRAGSESYSRLRDERSYKDALASLDGRREGPASKVIWEGHKDKEVGVRNLW
ncbi:serine/arginine-rich splicing factor 8-like [Hibiscus syriacus]|uniref:serine/arginine-rich splicing factor 8-like n=1 Tax=Hibiscus syriacus TaxID=106335 RepID=UPI0019229C4F|nr:serine/arginine-rich splicing factor 8-like [Hibiscus syriacus]